MMTTYVSGQVFANDVFFIEHFEALVLPAQSYSSL